MTLFLSQVLNGLSFGALLFLLASGFTLVFGMMRVINLAHGAFYLIGGYVGLTTALTFGSFPLALLAGALSMAVLAFLVEGVLLRRVGSDASRQVLLTIGLATIAADLGIAIWSGNPRSIPLPDVLTGAIQIGSVNYPRQRTMVIALAVVIGAGLFYLQRRTRIGAIVRAGVDDAAMVDALGINIGRVLTGVFVLGGALAGIAGVVGGSILSLYPGADTEILIYALVVVIVGGLGSLPGAALGSLLIGLIDAFARTYAPSFSYVSVFAPMILILVLRPRGILGRA